MNYRVKFFLLLYFYIGKEKEKIAHKELEKEGKGTKRKKIKASTG